MSLFKKVLRAVLRLEPLEDRLALSWAAVPPPTINRPAALSLTLDHNSTASGTASITRNEIDYYTFVANQTGLYNIHAQTPTSALDTVLGVFNASGQRLAYNDDISSSNYDSQVNLHLTAGQRYYFGITNYTGTAGGDYSWSIQGPARLTDDSYEDNDSLFQAKDLGTLTDRETLSDLVMADSADWFRFTMNGPGRADSSVSLGFTHAQGDLDLRLYDASGNLIRYSDSTDDSERVSLDGLALGTYYVQVYGYRGATNPSYRLDINPGIGSGGTAVGNHVLYLNFDGYHISRAELTRWAGQDWASSINDIDSDRNGIHVQPFLASRADRDQIIARMMELLQEDLRPFGIAVTRITGGAIEGQGATTVFLGRSTLTNGNYHVASDVDRGNNNRTDIAFVGDENWGSVERTALALADVTLHEAGHTWGLWHVNSGTYAETMGLRYSTSNQSQWVRNTSFLDRTFAAFSEDGYSHGPGPQNSYRTMLQVFTTTSVANHGFTIDTSQRRVFSVTLSTSRVDVVRVRRLRRGNIEVRINGHVYELARGYRQVRIYTDGDRRDRVRVLNRLRGVRVRVNRGRGADLQRIVKADASLAILWNGSQRTSSDQHNLGCGCPCCCGA